MPIIYTLGELLVEIMRPRPELPLNTVAEFQGPFPSGAPAIFISTIARLRDMLGCQATIIGAVGPDKFGCNILERLRRDGVEVGQVYQSERPTAVAFVAYQADGTREFIYHIGGTAADDLPSDLHARLHSLAKPDAFHVMGCSLMASEVMRRAIVQAVQYYSDCEISFDPNLRPELLQGRSFQEIAGEVMQHCSILLPGEVELLLAADVPISNIGAITQNQIEAAVHKLYKKYSRLRLIHLKCGKRGSCIYSRDSQILKIPRYPIERIMPVVDPTGAGDCFDAVFVTTLLCGMSLQESGFLAAKAGALNVATLGPMEGDMSLLYKKLLEEDQYITLC